MVRVIALLVVFAAAVTGGYFLLQPKEEKLPVINPVDIVEEGVVHEDLLRIGYGHTIGDFTFTDQNGKSFGRKDVLGKVYVAEFFFTTCGTICPKMNAQMQRVQRALSSEDQFEILSFTVNPEVDTVEQMKLYATEHGANDNQWHFLTGEKDKLYEVARKSFFLLKPAEAQNLGDAGSDFIHTNNFVLVDKQGRIRGYYDGTSTDEVDVLIGDVRKLLEDK